MGSRGKGQRNNTGRRGMKPLGQRTLNRRIFLRQSRQWLENDKDLTDESKMDTGSGGEARKTATQCHF